jgi:hypothetical protein
MKKFPLWIMLWTSVAALYVIIMIMVKMPLVAVITMATFRIIVGFFITTTTIQMKWIWKWGIVSLVLVIPLLLVIGWNDQDELLPIILGTIIFGWLIWFLVEKYWK